MTPISNVHLKLQSFAGRVIISWRLCFLSGVAEKKSRQSHTGTSKRFFQRRLRHLNAINTSPCGRAVCSEAAQRAKTSSHTVRQPQFVTPIMHFNPPRHFTNCVFVFQEQTLTRRPGALPQLAARRNPSTCLGAHGGPGVVASDGVRTGRRRLDAIF